jgi:hypothetical protein
MSDEQGAIETNEELECFVGMNVDEAVDQLKDVGVEYQLLAKGIWYNDPGYFPNRVRLFIDPNNVVQSATYG